VPLTIKDVFPLPLVDECLDTLAGNVWYSKLDANSAYWQVKIKPEDCSKTAFWLNVYASRSHYSTHELYFFLKQFTFF
jgi:hypothetical protein